MNKEQFQEKYNLSLPLKTRKEFEVARRRMGALTKDEKTILSAIVLQKGEAEAGEILANSPEQLNDYTILKGVNSYAALGRYYLPTKLPSQRSCMSTWTWVRWAAAMRTSIPVCSSAATMCGIPRRNRNWR